MLNLNFLNIVDAKKIRHKNSVQLNHLFKVFIGSKAENNSDYKTDTN